VIGVAGIAAIGAIAAVLRTLQSVPNTTIAALLLLLVILVSATAVRVHVAIAVSVIATLAFNFFLLPPFYTLTLDDPQNCVALFVFLVVAVIASQLSAAVRARANEAVGRHRCPRLSAPLVTTALLRADASRSFSGTPPASARR
jgi:two-component system sensor histidine kinase KdpD